MHFRASQRGVRAGSSQTSKCTQTNIKEQIAGHLEGGNKVKIHDWKKKSLHLIHNKGLFPLKQLNPMLYFYLAK